MNDYTLVHDRIEQIYKDGFSTQSLTEQLEGATEVEAERIRREMKAELNLVSPLQIFSMALVVHVRIEFGKQSEDDVARSRSIC